MNVNNIFTCDEYNNICKFKLHVGTILIGILLIKNKINCKYMYN